MNEAKHNVTTHFHPTHLRQVMALKNLGGQNPMGVLSDEKGSKEVHPTLA